MNLTEIQTIAYLLPQNKNEIIKFLQFFIIAHNINPQIKQIVITSEDNFFILKILPFELILVIDPNLKSFMDVHRFCANDVDLFNIDIFYDFRSTNISSFWGMTLRSKINWGDNKGLGRFFYKSNLEQWNPYNLIKNKKIEKIDLAPDNQKNYILYFLNIDINNDFEADFWNQLIRNHPKNVIVNNSLNTKYRPGCENQENISISDENNMYYLPALISKSRGVYTNVEWVSNLSCLLNRKTILCNSNKNDIFFDDGIIEVKLEKSLPVEIRYFNEKVQLSSLDDLFSHLEKELL